MKVAEITIYSTKGSWFELWFASLFNIPLRHIEVNVDGMTYTFGDAKKGLEETKKLKFPIYKDNMMFEQLPSHVSAVRLAEIIVGEIEEMAYYGADHLTMDQLTVEATMRDIAGLG